MRDRVLFKRLKASAEVYVWDTHIRICDPVRRVDTVYSWDRSEVEYVEICKGHRDARDHNDTGG